MVFKSVVSINLKLQTCTLLIKSLHNSTFPKAVSVKHVDITRLFSNVHIFLTNFLPQSIKPIHFASQFIKY